MRYLLLPILKFVTVPYSFGRKVYNIVSFCTMGMSAKLKLGNIGKVVL